MAAPYAFDASETDAIAAFFGANGFVGIRNTCSAEDCDFLNDFMSESQQRHPERWSQRTQWGPGPTNGGEALPVERLQHPEHYREFVHPLLWHEELDRFTHRTPLWPACVRPPPDRRPRATPS